LQSQALTWPTLCFFKNVWVTETNKIFTYIPALFWKVFLKFFTFLITFCNR
jgi:hypothetical protein